MKKLKRLFQIIFNSNVLLMLLIVVYPISFFMSANPTTYYPDQYLLAILILLSAALIVSGVIEFVFYLLKTNPFYSTREKRIVYILAIFPIALEPLHRVTILIIPSFKVLVVSVIALLLFILYLGNKWAKVINFLIFALLSTCLIIYSWAIFEGEMRSKVFSNIISDTPEISGLQFVSSPNVYYFYLESYHGREAMVEIYKYDNSEFYDYLLMNKFRVYDNAYSNYSYTIHSLIGTFQMRHNYYYLLEGTMESAIGGKEIIAGRKNNNLFNAFRNNGYNINFFLTHDWVNPYRTRNTNITISNNSVLNFLYNKTFSLLIQIREAWKGDPPTFTDFNTYTYSSSTYVDEMQKMIKEASIGSIPQFFFIETGVVHIPPVFSALPPEVRENASVAEYNDRPYKFVDYFTEEYVSTVKTFNNSFVRILEQIIEEDPGAVIVLLGDHGTNKYRNIDRKGIDNMFSVMSEAGITNRDFANSMFNVLLAIRMPPDLSLPDTDTISNVNVFRYVLSALSKTTHLVDNKEDDISLTRDVISVRDGKPLEYPEFIELKEFQRQKLVIK